MNMTSLKKLDFCDTAELVEPKLVEKLSKESLAHRHPPVNSLSIWAEISFGLLTLRGAGGGQDGRIPANELYCV